MMRTLIGLATLALGAFAATAPALGQPLGFSWRELPSIPANRNDWSPAIPVDAAWWRQIGLAGPITGVHRDMLLVGGGANFPEPGQTATRANTLGKVYWDEVFVLNLASKTWLDKRFKLPRALAYASTISLPEGVLVIGGEGHDAPNGNARSKLRLFPDVFLMSLDAAGDTLDIKPYPSLPRGMSYSAAALVGRTVYLQGGADFLALDLDAPDAGWKALPAWPGEPRDLALAAAVDGKFVLASGRYRHEGRWLLHRDAYAFDPKAGRWARLPDMPYPAQAGQGFAVQDRYFVALGGDRDVDRWNQFALLEAERGKAEKDSPAWQRANTAVTFMQDHHTGFNQGILVYDTQARAWSENGFLPCPAPATTQPVTWKGELLLVSGEVAPGKRTPKIWAGLPVRK